MAAHSLKQNFLKYNVENKEIIKLLRLHAKLLDYHGANSFKIKAVEAAAQALQSIDERIDSFSAEKLEGIEGVGKSIAKNIIEIIATGSFDELEELFRQTPKGIRELLFVKGIGPKKLRTIYEALNLSTLDEILEAAKKNQLAKLKGFGEKTQEKILKILTFKSANKHRKRFADALPLAQALKATLENLNTVNKVSETGKLRRVDNALESLDFLLATDSIYKSKSEIEKLDKLIIEKGKSGPFVLRGRLNDDEIPVNLHFCTPERYANRLFWLTGSENHMSAISARNEQVLDLLHTKNFASEEHIYKELGLPYFHPEIREGQLESSVKGEVDLIELSDLKGILHNHSTYSDGKNTLREMAEFCKEIGYEYLGITDHSVTAFYANGLKEAKIREQHEEIDQLNKELAPFKIFKGIESDILNDGSLDYPENILKSFDFIVASIHANLEMDIKKATGRLLKAIENPYTTILGHMTGRLILEREGYPVDHKLVIDTCAKNNVVIEINANPWRLDIDWRWIHYALDKGVLLSVNPDAHEKNGYYDMYFGVKTGRKGGLTRSMTLNAMNAGEIEEYFQKKKAAVL